MLCVLDLPGRGEVRGEVAIGMAGSWIEFIVENMREGHPGRARELDFGGAMENLPICIMEEA